MMEILHPILLVITFVAVIATIFVAPIAWFRSIKNMFVVVRHIKSDAYEKYPSLKWNRFNAIFCPSSLDEKGQLAKKELLKNILIFIGSIFLTVSLCQITGLT